MKNKEYIISSKNFSITDIKKIIDLDYKIKLSSYTNNKVVRSRKFLDHKISQNKPIYGVNTGFGSLCNERISNDNLGILQENLIRSHAAGIGDIMTSSISKIMLLLKIKSLSHGFSGISLKCIKRLVYFFNNNIIPVVYSQGSLGASGDLAPLAHLSLPLIGEGKVFYKGKIQTTKNVYKKLGLKKINLLSKEGLALLNGTQFMGAVGVYSLIKAQNISILADLISSVSIIAFNCHTSPYDESLSKIKPFPGLIETAANIRKFIRGSNLNKTVKKHVQDPYSFRCIPQVHGATKDVIKHTQDIFSIEINSVSDNPSIFDKENKILSGGNFHGQSLALAFDYLSISLSELSNISERRIFKLLSGERELPPYLINNSGLNSGLMIAQYTAASIVSQNKQLCTPCSVDSIVSSNGQEDHVSMGANAAIKTLQVIENVERVLSIELLSASQAMCFSANKLSKHTNDLLYDYRKIVQPIKKDTILSDLIEDSADFVSRINFIK
tara:strand:+ start:609 stop:2102 length:1494 start_codon:yes stop_codon:yes gene_type:complete